MTCRAHDCPNEAIPSSQEYPQGSGGACHDAAEVEPVKPKRTVDPAVIERRNETRRKNRLKRLAQVQERALARRLGRTG